MESEYQTLLIQLDNGYEPGVCIQSIITLLGMLQLRNAFSYDCVQIIFHTYTLTSTFGLTDGCDLFDLGILERLMMGVEVDGPKVDKEVSTEDTDESEHFIGCILMRWSGC